jgi:hypothetical protein
MFSGISLQNPEVNKVPFLILSSTKTSVLLLFNQQRGQRWKKSRIRLKRKDLLYSYEAKEPWYLWKPSRCKRQECAQVFRSCLIIHDVKKKASPFGIVPLEDNWGVEDSQRCHEQSYIQIEILPDIVSWLLTTIFSR